MTHPKKNDAKILKHEVKTGKSSKKRRAMAIVSFILSLAFWIPLLNLIFGPLAVITGVASWKAARDKPNEYGGRWLALIGIILGSVPVVFALVGLGMCLTGFKEICINMGLGILAR